jgi:hypothetical protein
MVLMRIELCEQLGTVRFVRLENRTNNDVEESVNRRAVDGFAAIDALQLPRGRAWAVARGRASGMPVT